MRYSLTLALGLTTVPLTGAVPHYLEVRADAYCSNGIYGELAPILAPYQIAQAFCTAVFPVKCTTAPKQKRVASSTAVTATTSTTKSTTPSTTKSSSANAQASAWSKIQSQAAATISSLCACIETTKVRDVVSLTLVP